MSNTVLIADDAEFMRVMLRDILSDMGLEVVGEAGDGRKALDLYRRCKPDLVALDLTMPKMDGLAALRKILAEDPLARVVAITALGQKEKVIAAIQAGARDFIVKPFEYERVQATIGRLLAKAVA
jgi:two-component system chemotaxis response regulator CheY